MAACARLPATDIAGHLPDLHFNLMDDSGNRVTEKTYRGQVVVVYFGYTSCGGECPATLSVLRDTLAFLGPDGRDVRILFVTTQPELDTPRVLHTYLNLYDPSPMTGLTGPRSELRNFARHLRAAWPVLSDFPATHGTAVYVFDRQGHARNILWTGEEPATLHRVLSARLQDTFQRPGQ